METQVPQQAGSVVEQSWRRKSYPARQHVRCCRQRGCCWPRLCPGIDADRYRGGSPSL